ncbi:MAG: phosphoenolpyruvate synthase, partial [Cyanobacteria bacterium NC_groundwater_1444_Ag_S-0.65um_54_12]|nr:phosphoenolpyruvate synthase [Cyanobacteria bacterium NC_groundwater_1444_Ag_S-0.65um_54_12]
CWESARAPGITAYRAAQGLTADTVAVAVIVQEMVPAEVSGILFTANPASGKQDEIVIRAAYGLGEGVVGDLVETDGFFVRHDEIRAELAEKTQMVTRDTLRGSGTTIVPVAVDRCHVPCLSDVQVRELAQVGRTIALACGAPQDIEWAYAAGQLHILQTRPITTLGPGYSSTVSSDGSDRVNPGHDTLTFEPNGREIIWDNSNITESYSGVTSVLTFSFASNAYYIVYQQVSALLGVPEQVIKANLATYRNLLGLMKGRVYYNLKNWYRLVALLPGFAANKAFMEQMMGVKEPIEISVQESRTGLIARWAPLAFIGWRLVRNFLDLDRLVEEFLQRFYKTYNAYRKRNFAEMHPQEIVELYDLLEREILHQWKAPIVTDIFAMICYGVLKKLCHAWCASAGESLQNDLLCGEGGIESTEPTKALMRMARRIRDAERLAREFALRSPAELESWWRESPEPLRSELADFLDRYGFRCMNELKLEEPSLRDDPTFIFAMLKNYLVREDLSVEAMEAREREIRHRAETKVAAILRFHPLRRLVFGWMLANARKNVKNRENLRFARTKIFGLCRELFNAVGAYLARSGVLANARDIYHLTVPEIWGYLEGRATTTELRALAELRQREFASFRQADLGDRFTTCGIPYLNPLGEEALSACQVDTVTADQSILHGTSCCPGTVKGPVRVILSPSDDMRLNGEILVAERTDPGWVPLYPSASGLLIERGSILSHSAIVARELGIPAIVGIRNLTKRVRDGQVVEMDAKAGIVRLSS